VSLPRSGGVLLHPTSLPGRYGIGDLGPQAHKFIDWLAASGCSLWQVLPLGPTGYGNSPYQCHSVFAGNPNMISPEFLVRDGVLEVSDLLELQDLSLNDGQTASRIDFSRLIPWKQALLKRAFARFRRSAAKTLKGEFLEFRREHRAWLDDFSLFMAIKESYGGVSWTRWPAAIRGRQEDALANARRRLNYATARIAFAQMLFFRQWAELREHAQQSGIQIVGDVPSFAAADSSDLWAHPELFYLDEAGMPTVVAGVPPDFFAPTGQLWGNPLYRWENHAIFDYAWWLERLQGLLQLVDIIRLDHFRGFAGYWEIPAGATTAEIGRWVAGPAERFLDVVVHRLRGQSTLEGAPMIAEDLGVITPDVIRLRQRYGLPGMKVLQFGFTGPNEEFLPHNYVENCVAYTGTHDNDTGRGWFAGASVRERHAVLHYLHSSEATVVRDMVRAIWLSVAAFAIVPIQDILGLGNEARMNFPGKPEGNWEWRLREYDLTASIAAELRDLNVECSRLHDAGFSAAHGHTH
jgi:4-alpha-glucanotransferase